MHKAIPFIFFLLLVGASAKAQDDTTKPQKAATDSLPYLKYPTVPAFNIMQLDSNIFNTFNIPNGQPIALVFFDPDCKHCKATIKSFTEHMDSMANIQFYLFSARHDLDAIKGFYNKFHLEKYPNIKVVGMDTEFFFFSYYKVKFVPDIALYDREKKLIKLFEGAATVNELYVATH